MSEERALSWVDIKFITEDIDGQVRGLISSAEYLRDNEDPSYQNVWMGDILSSLSIVAEEIRSAYAKIALI